MKKLILTAMVMVMMATGAVAAEADGLRAKHRGDIGTINCVEFVHLSAPTWQRILTLGIYDGENVETRTEYQYPAGLTGLMNINDQSDEASLVKMIDAKIHERATHAWGTCIDDLGVTADFIYHRGEPSKFEIREIKK
ncbi:MAG: hypothetical protein AB7I29_14905 [Geobacter sp.]